MTCPHFLPRKLGQGPTCLPRSIWCRRSSLHTVLPSAALACPRRSRVVAPCPQSQVSLCTVPPSAALACPHCSRVVAPAAVCSPIPAPSHSGSMWLTGPQKIFFFWVFRIRAVRREGIWSDEPRGSICPTGHHRQELQGSQSWPEPP